MVCLGKVCFGLFNFQSCAPQILLGPFLDTLSHLSWLFENFQHHWTNLGDYGVFLWIWTILGTSLSMFSLFYISVPSYTFLFYYFITLIRNAYNLIGT